MKENDKIKTYALIVLTITLAISTPLLFLEKLEDQRKYEAYLNEFYKQLADTLYSVEYLLSTAEEKDLTKILMKVEHQLETTNLLLRIGNRTQNNNIKDQPRFFVGRIIQLNEDGSLTDDQRSELEKVQKGLDYIKEGLYSEETGQENNNLSAKEFNEIIEKGTSFGE